MKIKTEVLKGDCWEDFYSSSRSIPDFSREIRGQSGISFHREFYLTMKNKSFRRLALRAQWMALTRRVRRGKNAEAFLNTK